MKPASRFAFLFTLLLVTFIMLASTALAYDTNESQTERTQTSTNITHQTIAPTERTTELRTMRLCAFTEDNRALRSRAFHMPETTHYVVSVFHGFGNVIRKARIKRKGNVQG